MNAIPSDPDQNEDDDDEGGAVRHSGPQTEYGNVLYVSINRGQPGVQVQTGMVQPLWTLPNMSISSVKGMGENFEFVHMYL